jgi:hypothetical protein
MKVDLEEVHLQICQPHQLEIVDWQSQQGYLEHNLDVKLLIKQTTMEGICQISKSAYLSPPQSFQNLFELCTMIKLYHEEVSLQIFQPQPPQFPLQKLQLSHLLLELQNLKFKKDLI